MYLSVCLSVCLYSQCVYKGKFFIWVLTIDNKDIKSNL